MRKQYITIITTIGLIPIFLSATDSLTKTCIGCHGKNFEKSALGASKVVNEMKKEKIKKRLKKFKDKNYAGVMKPFASTLSEEDIKQISEKFGQ